MGIAFRYAARSDVGRVRSKNDDSGYAGHYLAVVADGMGGHVGGDVASATTVLDLTPLDRAGFDGSAGVFLADEIQTANIIMNELVGLNPLLGGMGTTCTALIANGDQLELAHIGDSRAYRLRGDVFEQITTDHTFVQRLLEEGRISLAEAEHHPHKNVIMRVLGDVDASPELDLLTLDAEVGEKWLLSSDGLDAVVSVAEIEAVMRSTGDLKQITDRLVDLTLDRGAPDNVTVVTLAVIDEGSLSAAITAPQPIIPIGEYIPASAQQDDETAASDDDPQHRGRHWRRHLPEEANRRHALRHGKWRGASFSDGVFNMMTEKSGVDERPEISEESPAAVLRRELDQRPHALVGAAANATHTGMIPTVTDRTLERRATLARSSGYYTGEGAGELPEEFQALIEAPEENSRSFGWRLKLFTAALALSLLIGAVLTTFNWISQQYYVGLMGSKVAIYNGVPQSVGPIHLYSVVEETEVKVDDLPEYSRSLLSSTITARDLDDAHRIVADLQGQAGNYQRRPQPSASVSPSASVQPGTVTTVSPSPSDQSSAVPSATASEVTGG